MRRLSRCKTRYSNCARRTALDESVKLQSHYAGLLNTYDGGKRLQFRDRESWMERLGAMIAADSGEK